MYIKRERIDLSRDILQDTLYHLGNFGAIKVVFAYIFKLKSQLLLRFYCIDILIYTLLVITRDKT